VRGWWTAPLASGWMSAQASVQIFHLGFCHFTELEFGSSHGTLLHGSEALSDSGTSERIDSEIADQHRRSRGDDDCHVRTHHDLLRHCSFAVTNGQFHDDSDVGMEGFPII
jgi:hypothetical protein